jgi:hypothetical protein
VSLNGSPTVSPMTLAAWASDPGGHHLDDVEHQAPAEHIVGDSATTGRSISSVAMTCLWFASKDPDEHQIDIAPIIPRVVTAFLDSGNRKPVPPFEIASTPVRAVVPAANTLSTKNR